MSSSLFPVAPHRTPRNAALVVPAVIAAAGDRATECFVEFFAATIRNPNTRLA